MKKIIIALGLFIGSISVAQAQRSHVILITVDGFRPEFYKDPSWGMVHLRQAMAQGSYRREK